MNPSPRTTPPLPPLLLVVVVTTFFWSDEDWARGSGGGVGRRPAGLQRCRRSKCGWRDVVGCNCWLAVEAPAADVGCWVCGINFCDVFNCLDCGKACGCLAGLALLFISCRCANSTTAVQRNATAAAIHTCQNESDCVDSFGMTRACVTFSDQDVGVGRCVRVCVCVCVC